MSRFEARPTPAVLLWARQSAGLSLELAAQKAHFKAEQLRSWEEGSGRPSIAQLRKIAQTYKRPLAAFYLPEPPKRFEVMHDFRRLADEGKHAPTSPGLAQEIRAAYDRREWALELITALEEAVPKFPFEISPQDNEEEAALELRRALQVRPERQATWRDQYEALRQWRLLLERSGVLTFQTSHLKLEEARGFSISLRPLPVAVVNNKDAPRGRIFTFLHELSHILLNDGGICDLHDDEIEAYCNRVASAALFPRGELLETETVRYHGRGDPEWNDEELAALSRRFGGSREAALVRLLNLGLTTQSFFRRKRQEFLAMYQQQQQQEQAPGFAPPHDVNLASAGPLFTRLVIESLNQKKDHNERR